MSKVLVLGSDTRSFLSVVRSLGRRNIDVHIAWCSDSSIARLSRYISKEHELPEYNEGHLDWKKRLIALLKTEHFDLVIPTNDLVTIPLQKHRKDLSEYSKLYLLDDSTYQIVNSKSETTKLADSLKINTPKSRVVESISETEDLEKDFGFPIILKPLSSFDGRSNQKQTVNKIYDSQTLHRSLEKMLLRGPIQIQSNFSGIGVGLNVLAKDGELKVAYQHQRIHEPFLGGGSSYRKSTEINPDLLEATKKLLKALNYTGVAMVEFKYNIKTTEWVLIEINGRFWGSLPLAIVAGVDFPYYLFKLITEETAEFIYSYKTDVYCRNLEQDIQWLNSALLKSSKKDLSEMYTTKLKIFLELLRLITFREHVDTLAIDDLRPGIAEISRILRTISNSIGRRIRHSLLQTEKIREHKHKTLLNDLTKAQSILFVCKGNICRSPFAALAAKNIWNPKCELLSVGYFPKEDRSSPTIAIESAQKFGVELHNHRSRKISAEMVNKADVILFFDEENRSNLLERFPFAKDKFHWFSLLSTSGAIEIEDPYGNDISNFDRIYTRLSNLLEETKYLFT